MLSVGTTLKGKEVLNDDAMKISKSKYIDFDTGVLDYNNKEIIISLLQIKEVWNYFSLVIRTKSRYFQLLAL